MKNYQLVYKPNQQKKIRSSQVVTLWVSEISEITNEQYDTMSQQIDNLKTK